MIKLFTHTDLDGVGCATLAMLAFKDDIKITYCDVTSVNTDIKNYISNENNKDVMIYITDIRVNEEVAEMLNKRGKCKLFDHHQSALYLNEYTWCKVQVEDLEGVRVSATKLFYEYLKSNNYLNGKVNKSLNKFVDVVNDWDTWKWHSLGNKGLICQKINNLLKLYGKQDFIKFCLKQIDKNIFPKLDESIRSILVNYQREIDISIKRKNKEMVVAEMYGAKCGFVFADNNLSEIGNGLCELHPELDFIAMINMRGSVSYRTVKDNFDLGTYVTRLLNGGGHMKSAGSTFPKELRVNFVKEIFPQADIKREV